jgi:hypothetical protein
VNGDDPVTQARRATDEILAAMESAPRGVVVDSPPGAGKSTLVVRAAAELVGRGHRVMVIAQTNEQVDDLTDALATRLADSDGRIGRLTSGTWVISERVSRHVRTVTSARTLGELVECHVVLSTAHKWGGVKSDEQWPWAIVDEAYQMRSDLLLRVAGLFEKALFVGDPGQMDPFSVVPLDRWTGLSWDPTLSAVEVLLRHNEDVPVLRLPVSWRLPASAAPVVSQAFYPFSPFAAATSDRERSLGWGTESFGKKGVDRALELAADTGWALYELPAGHKPRTDREAAGACAALAARLLSRGAVATSGPASAPVTGKRVAIGTAHRDQAKAVRTALGRFAVEGVADVTVDTANSLQGREFDVTIVLHPLSGRRDATAFHLEAGRLCVLASRHRHACIVVARAGIPELLDAHPSVEPVHLNVPVKFPDGWEANQALMAHLSAHRVVAD